MAIEANELMRVAEVAPLLGVTSSRLYQLIALGLLPSVRIGGSIRIPRAAWEKWIETQTQSAMEALRSTEGDGKARRA